MLDVNVPRHLWKPCCTQVIYTRKGHITKKEIVSRYVSFSLKMLSNILWLNILSSCNFFHKLSNRRFIYIYIYSIKFLLIIFYETNKHYDFRLKIIFSGFVRREISSLLICINTISRTCFICYKVSSTKCCTYNHIFNSIRDGERRKYSHKQRY